MSVRLVPGQRRIVDDRRLFAAAPHHMAVNRVPAGVANAADEPAAVDAGIGIEYPRRRLVPVDLLRGFAPEALGVALPASIHSRIAALSGIHRALLTSE